MTVRYLVSALAAVSALVALPACYTLLKHPAVDNAAYEGVQANECTACHYEEDIWYFHHSPAYREYPGSAAAGWGFYYAAPWWYESYWRYTSPSEPGNIPLPGRQVRPAGGKDATRGAVGGHVTPPADPKSTGSAIRFRHFDDDSLGRPGNPGEKTTDDDNRKRDVRPKSAKEKPKGKGGSGS
jgi:hypothetical protein